MVKCIKKEKEEKQKGEEKDQKAKEAKEVEKPRRGADVNRTIRDVRYILFFNSDSSTIILSNNT